MAYPSFPRGTRTRALPLLRAGALLGLAFLTGSASAADVDVEQLREATAKLIKLLVDQGVLTREKAEAVLSDLKTTAPASAALAPAKPASGAQAVRVPYVPEFVRKELKDELRAELQAQAVREGWAGPGAVPEWVRGIEFNGDLRMRFQADRFADGNAPAVNVAATNSARALTLLNTSEDRERFRFRGRFGLTATIDENWAGGLRLSTGSLTDPVSANQTLGTYNQRYVVAFDRAYIRFRQGDAVNVVAGRFGSPWYGTELVWANDLSFDGVAAQWTPQLSERVRAFATLAVLPIQEVELAADKWLFGAQVGATLAGSPHAIGAKLGVGYYRYKNIVGQTSPTSSSLNEFTAPAFTQKGNTYYNISSDPNRPLLGLASQYRLVNVTGQIDAPVIADKRVILVGDFVRNLGFNRSEVSARVGSDVEPRVNGYQLRLGFGDSDVTRRKQWQAFVGYRRVERDAVLDAFTDSDFRLGGTDARGYVLGGSYGLGKNVAATLRLLSGDAISGPPLSVDVIQLDLNVRF